MNRRSKRTSYYQYEIFLNTMAANPLLAANRLTRTEDSLKWKELSEELNKCPSGPTLTPEEWRKRLYDWKNTTRAKHKKSLNCSDKNLYSLTLLENRALKIFYAQQLKKEQAADYLGDADQGEEDVKAEEFEDVDEDEDEFEEPQEVYPQTEPIIINAGLTSTQRLHLDGIGSILYEVTNFPEKTLTEEVPAPDYNQQIVKQLKRISDIQEAALQFKIASFKYKNPGFDCMPE
ncbi:uncharacterized protein Dana_GF13735 [Drosophila ananassae]|uniref:Regulatory protein zeste n=1 Tax=Drosophila ananassae TaxID=7217 RepID=B3MHZ1_DROAN|nr:uncharacterized protein LOC6496571 [Drosophila ananassae]EDV38001.1 uncharacterized protein Dana_GF13735 [Drosophila ananassae]